MNETQQTAMMTRATRTEGPAYLDPKRLHFFRHGALLRLTIAEDRSCLKVQVFRAFPLSNPKGYYSVRDGDGKDLGMIRDPSELVAENRELLDEELDRRYFTPAIQRVVSITERFGTVEWEVETDRGHARFTTRDLRENLIRPSRGRYIMTSVDGNRFDVPDIRAMDPQSREWLLRHL
jgi:hypothetical protein